MVPQGSGAEEGFGLERCTRGSACAPRDATSGGGWREFPQVWAAPSGPPGECGVRHVAPLGRNLLSLVINQHSRRYFGTVGPPWCPATSPRAPLVSGRVGNLYVEEAGHCLCGPEVLSGVSGGRAGTEMPAPRLTEAGAIVGPRQETEGTGR